MSKWDNVARLTGGLYNDVQAVKNYSSTHKTVKNKKYVDPVDLYDEESGANAERIAEYEAEYWEAVGTEYSRQYDLIKRRTKSLAKKFVKETVKDIFDIRR